MKINAIMKELQKMQEKAVEAQSAVQEITAEGTAGGGAVKIKITGGYKVISVELSDDIVREQDKEMLEDMIRVALEDAFSQVEKRISDISKNALQGFSIPGMPSL